MIDAIMTQLARLMPLLLIIVSVDSAYAASFSKSKKVLAKMYVDHSVSFYCGCDYALQPRADKPNKKRLELDWSTCGFEARKNRNRVSKYERALFFHTIIGYDNIRSQK